MNKRTLVILVVVVVAVVGILSFVLLNRSSGQSQNQAAVLTAKQGNVFVSKEGPDNWFDAQIGLSLNQNDVIKVDKNSRAEITFFEGSIIELESDTVLTISDIVLQMDKGPTNIKLEQQVGRTTSRVKKFIDPASKYQIDTVAGSATVRGTTMVVDVDAQGITTVHNVEGIVVAISQGKETLVPEGTQCVMIPGEQPSIPITGPGYVRIIKNIKSESGKTITYVYEVTNIGDNAQTNVFVTDNEVSNILFVSGDDNNNKIFDPGETWVFTGTAEQK